MVAALQETGLPPDRLDLEITESVLIDDSAAAFAVLEELRTKGIGIALDDFGTGFASLSYLSDFAFSKIKIDQKFSQDLDHSSRTSAIIKATAQISRELHIECVAEGIETEPQLERMRGFGINAMQGYLFSRPLPPRELRELIAQPIAPPRPRPQRARGRPREPPRRKIASSHQCIDSSRSRIAIRMNFDSRTCSKYMAFGSGSHDGSTSSKRGKG